MKPVKKKMTSIENFDPRPPEYRGTAATRLPSLLESISGQGLCISLLDPKCKHWDSDDSSSKVPACNMPNLDTLRNMISAFKETLQLSEDKIRHIEQNTREQRRSPLWHSVRRYRLTASNFGAVMSRRLDTAPDNLVLHLLQPREISTPAMRYGIEMEPVAIAQYVQHQNTHGHPGLTVSSSGFIRSASHPFLGASPDGVVYDPSNSQQPFGFVEVKSPYKVRNILPAQACSTLGFFCTIDGTGHLQLKKNHSYYAQVQGQMAVGQRPWCDFVVYTTKQISVQRIGFDESFWKDALLPKLSAFYDNCVCPEIVSPVHALGLPVRDLSKL